MKVKGSDSSGAVATSPVGLVHCHAFSINPHSNSIKDNISVIQPAKY